MPKPKTQQFMDVLRRNGGFASYKRITFELPFTEDKIRWMLRDLMNRGKITKEVAAIYELAPEGPRTRASLQGCLWRAFHAQAQKGKIFSLRESAKMCDVSPGSDYARRYAKWLAGEGLITHVKGDVYKFAKDAPGPTGYPHWHRRAVKRGG